MSKSGPKASHIRLVDATEAVPPFTLEACGGRTKSGGSCKKPAGQGTEHSGIGQCRHHDGQVEAGSQCPLPLTDLELRLWGEITDQLRALRVYSPAYWPHIYGLVIALAGLHSARQSALGAAAIVKGDNSLEAGTPESFNVLIKEMQSLGLDVRPGRRGASKEGTDEFSLDDLTV